MDLILLCSIFFLPSESKLINESVSNIVAHEVTNLTLHNGTLDTNAEKVLATSTKLRGNGTELLSKFTFISKNNNTGDQTPDNLIKRIIENDTNIQLTSTPAANSNATDPKKDEKVERAAGEMSGGIFFGGNGFIMNRLIIDDSFPEIPFHKKVKRFNNVNSTTSEPARNFRKRFTFFRRLIFI
ncbi:hypothetical protein TNIN_330421 [Trichonephila inaurata madagascariensis]|uniref:Uncharacterized protein n=1 Tax=Trichonephila inaurata madagascariensis TaxID=2747483 RepID=A0A8X7CFG2_9ARAC|nr:hypothetical protein TNIN_330421 [Trichonephila inaurata madagascariensis]